MEKHVYQNDVTEWFVAESVEQAIELARAMNVKNEIPEDEMELDFRQTPDDTVLTIADYGPMGERANKRAAEFAAENEPGFLATTEY